MPVRIFRSGGPGRMMQELDPGTGPEGGHARPSSCRPPAPQVLLRTDPAVSYQEVMGFGASFTDSSAYLVAHRLPPAARRGLMDRLFDPVRGIGLSVLRNPMGACDYSRDFYTYDDQPPGREDRRLGSFSIRHDLDAILPLTRWAMRLNPELRLIASPWSPPAWMKTSGSMIGGRLRVDCLPVYADYFVRFIREYARLGVPVYAVTPQNEPLYEPGNYPGMILPADQEADFIRDHLRPALDRAGLDTRILGYDHNWDRPDYPLDLIDRAGGSLDGIAWHWYAGSPETQGLVSGLGPGCEAYVTEGSGGQWIPPFRPAFAHLMKTGIAAMRQGARCLVLWNLALDAKGGPVVPGFGTSTCRGLVTVGRRGRVDYNLDYYGLAHFSRFVRPGARRIGMDQAEGLPAVAFRNTDGSQVAVLFNDRRASLRLGVRFGPARREGGADLTLWPGTAATLVCQPDTEEET
ncbi:glycoside hydrolase family 30 protein [Bifidobacterium favimelis]|uniref:Glycoside hydrolase family 30 beta sandwich domain-containing protein n=1 Tax=Bifidobacterium favimelis TaxID=3122979 RepID=A0ABU8ZNV0_9BIFI